MPQRVFEQTSQVSVPDSTVYAHFATPQRMVGFQPFVRAVDQVRHEEGNGEQIVRYRLVEAVPLLGGIKITAVSQVQVRLPESCREIVQHVDAGLGVRVDAVVTLSPVDAHTTLIEERLTVTAPLLLIRYVAGRAHQALVARHDALRGGYLTAHPLE